MVAWTAPGEAQRGQGDDECGVGGGSGGSENFGGCGGCWCLTLCSLICYNDTRRKHANMPRAGFARLLGLVWMV